MKHTVCNFDFTKGDIEAFFRKYPTCDQKIKSIAHNYLNCKAFEQIYQTLQEKVKGTELQNEKIFKNEILIKEELLLSVKIGIFHGVIENLLLKEEKVVNEDTIFKFITQNLVMEILNSYITDIIDIVNTVNNLDMSAKYHATNGFN